ncbi:MAG: leucine-rich repeat domain-containing protein [Clostridiales bacterium]|nr:leucine-rich repeat domain-containing protein [Clostridiales bacterium]
MNKKLTRTGLIATLVLVVTLVCVLSATATYAVWQRNVSADKEIVVPIGDNNPSLKYLKFKGLNAQGEFADEGITQYAVVGYDGLVAEIIIPEVYTVDEVDYPVVMVTTDPDNLYYRFRDNEIITTITIPSSVTVIKDFAFAGMSSLVKVTIEGDAGTITIGDHAFAYCTSLTTFNHIREVEGDFSRILLGTPWARQWI